MAKATTTQPAPPKPAPAPKGRLGEDLVKAPLSREPLSILIARSDVAGGAARIKAQAPGVLRVAPGQIIQVKHAYRLQEHSPEREEYRFLLKSRLDGRDHPPSLARLGDQWGVPEDISGYLQHEYKLTGAGTHTLEFEVGAEYCIMGWSDTTVQALDRKDLTGRIDIIVG